MFLVLSFESKYSDNKNSGVRLGNEGTRSQKKKKTFDTL